MSRRSHLLIEEADDAPRLSAAEAPPVEDLPQAPTGQAMRTMAVIAARKPTFLGRWFRRSAALLVSIGIGAALWTALDAALAASPVLGTALAVVLGVFCLTLLGLCLREVAALMRLARVGDIQDAARAAIAEASLPAARRAADRIARLYQDREALRWGRARFDERRGDLMDADAVLALAERELMAPLDAAARAEVEAAARQVAAVTAIVPLAFADIATALFANLRMIRRIAEIYGGRAGTLGSLRLTRAVFTHLVATGAVAVGDDLIHSVAGGSVLARLSRRFGEGMVNGALTARVGIAAMEVCRPLPFAALPRPQVSRLLGRALSGLFPTSKDPG